MEKLICPNCQSDQIVDYCKESFSTLDDETQEEVLCRIMSGYCEDCHSDLEWCEKFEFKGYDCIKKINRKEFKL